MSTASGDVEEFSVLVIPEEDSRSPAHTVADRPFSNFEFTNPALEMGEVRGLHGRVVKWDRNISYQVFRWYHEHINSRLLLMVLEISGHGVPWLLIPILFFFFDSDLTDEHAWLLVNFYGGQLLDLVYVSVMKTTVRRARPRYNQGELHMTIQTVDQFSFPSGHATRVIYVSAFVFYMAFELRIQGFLLSPLVLGLIAVWSVFVAYSRVALGRHHVLDIVGGIFVGLLNMTTVLYLWISEETITHWRHALFSKAQFATTRFIQALA